jgi:hypothetical protein
VPAAVNCRVITLEFGDTICVVMPKCCQLKASGSPSTSFAVAVKVTVPFSGTTSALAASVIVGA